MPIEEYLDLIQVKNAIENKNIEEIIKMMDIVNEHTADTIIEQKNIANCITDYITSNHSLAHEAARELTSDYKFYECFSTMFISIYNADSDACRDTTIYGMLTGGNDKEETVKRMLTFFNAIQVRNVNPEPMREILGEMVEKFLNSPIDYDLNSKEGIKNYFLQARLSLVITQALQNDPDKAFQNKMAMENPLKYNLLEDKISYFVAASNLPTIEFQLISDIADENEMLDLKVRNIKEITDDSELESGGFLSRKRIMQDVARSFFEAKHSNETTINFKTDLLLYGIGKNDNLYYEKSLKNKSITELCSSMKRISDNLIIASKANFQEFLVAGASSFLDGVNQAFNLFSTDLSLQGKISEQNFSGKMIFIGEKSLADLASEYKNSYPNDASSFDIDTIQRAILAKSFMNPESVVSLATIKMTSQGIEPTVFTLNRDYSNLISKCKANHNIFRKFTHALGFKYPEERCEIAQRKAINKFEQANIKENIMQKVSDMLNPKLLELNEEFHLDLSKANIVVKELENNKNINLENKIGNNKEFNKELSK